ncbi:HAD family hydrolase [Chakrabartyella piscis]|uniref:HAD family hydrolase n=1 Tax=Chakrabartyella piscis TaxID=2918914 RepID=UPI002958C585|nr:HAD family hydrolase [Chakrabartyella piscis]
MVKAVIFDLDGTLLNTITDIANGCNFALEQLGLPIHPVEAYKYFVGNGRNALVRSALGDNFTEERYAQALVYNDTHYAAHGEDVTAPYDGILDLLQACRKAGILCAVVSNKPHQFCEVLVPKYFGDLLNPIYGCVDGTAPKPDPHLVFQVLETLDLQPEDVLYVGDSGVDMQTAKNSHVKACGVLWGFRKADELLANGADVLCETVADLEQLIFASK